MRLAIIPARGGSKRIPRKNIKSFHGKPIIAYSIEALQKSDAFDKVIVSTDDQEIAIIAEQYGAEVPFIRPSEIADDYATTAAVIKHAVEWHQTSCEKINLVCCLYATAPFVQVEDIKQAIGMLDETVDCIFSATEFSYPIERSFRLDDDQRPEMFWPENFGKRSQDLEAAYHDAGMFYIAKPEVFLKKKSLFGKGSKVYLLPYYRVQDIDTPDDWRRAEKFYQILYDSNSTE